MDLKINNILVKSNDVSSFNVDLRSDHGKVQEVSIYTVFKTSAQEERPLATHINFPSRYNEDYDPIKYIEPVNLLAYGDYKATSGGFSWLVKWWNVIQGDPIFATNSYLELIGITRDNGTNISASSDTSLALDSETLTVQNDVAKKLVAFNTSLELVEIHCLDPISTGLLDLKINNIIVKSKNIDSFDVDLLNDIYGEVQAVTVPIKFNTTQEERPPNIEIRFNKGHMNYDKLYNPLEYIKPIYLISHGEYNKTIGGLLWLVKWVVTGSDSANHQIKIVGTTKDNSTIISASVVEEGADYLRHEDEPASIAEKLAGFNTSLGLVQLHYLAAMNQTLSLHDKEDDAEYNHIDTNYVNFVQDINEKGAPIISVLMLRTEFIKAMRLAEAIDSSIDYNRLKSDPSICLLYNLGTQKCKFFTKQDWDAQVNLIEGRNYTATRGYIRAYPWIEFAETLEENNANLDKYGWPDYEKYGI